MDTTQSIIGTIKPPVSTFPNDPQEAVGKLIAAGINIFILIAGIAVLIFGLWGAFDWITSGGDKEKVTKAQLKITNAVVGIIIVILVLSISCFINVYVIKITDDIGTCLNFKIPTL